MDHPTTFTVAIDGPAAAGKGTLCRALADHFGFAHLDTGLLYRATGARMTDGEDPVAAAETLRRSDLDRGDLRSSEVGQAASIASAIPEVRQALHAFQVDFAGMEGGAILDGRDIGTMICPEADVKVFCTASDRVRAERRHRELAAAGSGMTLDSVLTDLQARDARDSERATSPLAAAPDAHVFDTSGMTPHEVVEAVKAIVSARLGRK